MPVVRARTFASIERHLSQSLTQARQTSTLGGTGRTLAHIECVLHEAAFLQGFVAWERFMEDAFIAYMMKARPLGGRSPRQYFEPTSASDAYRFLQLIAGRRPYIDWTDPGQVRSRADVVFRGGGRFTRLSAHHSVIQDMKQVRNAISHHSSDARTKFEALVRRELVTLPSKCTPGRFLRSSDPRANLGSSFLDKYLGAIATIADGILR